MKSQKPQVYYHPRHQLHIEQELVQLRQSIDPTMLRLPTHITMDEIEEIDGGIVELDDEYNTLVPIY